MPIDVIDMDVINIEETDFAEFTEAACPRRRTWKSA
jgi:hypothetical protein